MFRKLTEKLSKILSLIESVLEFACLFLLSVPWVLTTLLLVSYLKAEEVLTGKKTAGIELEIAGFKILLKKSR